MLNHITIMGRLTRDPELRRTGSGLAVASFSVAVERDYPNKETDLKRMLDKIKAAGITPGLHFLHTHIGMKSRYVTPVPDRRLNLKMHYTLAKWLCQRYFKIGVDKSFYIV